LNYINKKGNISVAKRILLYYPYFDIPSPIWIRSALLYYDQISSILIWEPENSPISDLLKNLYSEGIYNPIIMPKLENLKQLREFEDSFISFISSDEFKNLLENNPNFNNNRSFEDYRDTFLSIRKFTDKILNFLLSENLANINRYNPERVNVEKIIAIVYMAFLSQFLAAINENIMIPSTDEKIMEEIVFNLKDTKLKAGKLFIKDCLPIPDAKVPIEKIIKFREKRKEQLLEFRSIIDSSQEILNKAESPKDANEKALKFKEEVELKLTKIKKALNTGGIDSFSSSFSSLLNLEQSKLFGSMAAGGFANYFSNNPIIGLSTGAVSLTLCQISSFIKIRKESLNSPYSYLFYAEKEKILNKE
jgi:hypothetical protein